MGALRQVKRGTVGAMKDSTAVFRCVARGGKWATNIGGEATDWLRCTYGFMTTTFTTRIPGSSKHIDLVKRANILVANPYLMLVFIEAVYQFYVQSWANHPDVDCGNFPPPSPQSIIWCLVVVFVHTPSFGIILRQYGTHRSARFTFTSPNG